MTRSAIRRIPGRLRAFRSRNRDIDRLLVAKLQALMADLERDGSEVDVLYLGDSVWERISTHDTDRRTLAEMVAARMPPDVTIRGVSHTSLHASVYLAIIRALQSFDLRPAVVIVPVNLRSFSPQWWLNPAWQFPRAMRYLRSVIESRGGSAGFADPAVTSFDAFDATPVTCASSELATVGQFREVIASKPADDAAARRRREAIFAFHYLAAIDPGHERLKALCRLLETVDAMGATTVLEVTPVNQVGGVRLLGDAFEETVRANVATIRSAVTSCSPPGTLRFLDLSERLPQAGFFHDFEPTEHLNETGRAVVASEIGTSVDSILRASRRQSA